MNREVVSFLSGLESAPSIVTIGAFDGVHRGHQHLLGLASESADAKSARVIAITFEPLPGQVFSPDRFSGRITTNQRRRELLWKYGAHSIVELQFSREMARETAGEFVDELRAIGPILEIWVGDDFALGHNREGTPDRLRELMADDGTEVHGIPRITWQQREVSSSAIREYIKLGAAREASHLLGRRFEVSGEVVKGGQVGRQIGFPTANVAPPRDIVPLRDGIYATFARIDDEAELRPAMTYIGTRPAVNTGERMIETHLLDFDDDLYGKMLTTEFVTHLRPDSDFPGLDALIEQLGHDEAATRTVLSQELEPAKSR
ncbi:MAG: riboflavin biosynthesis protein RibF [Thermomicrobiales bacterium]|nr:riboflavin biosynthesis protein RibF [Thermomicrobiales bacterium]